MHQTHLIFQLFPLFPPRRCLLAATLPHSHLLHQKACETFKLSRSSLSANVPTRQHHHHHHHKSSNRTTVRLYSPPSPTAFWSQRFSFNDDRSVAPSKTAPLKNIELVLQIIVVRSSSYDDRTTIIRAKRTFRSR